MSNPIKVTITGGNATINVAGNNNDITVGGTGNDVTFTGHSNVGRGGGPTSGGMVSLEGRAGSWSSGGGQWRVSIP
ncbi:MAG: hypothetical protein AAF628_35240 [Planctomycetota bacterium]